MGEKSTPNSPVTGPGPNGPGSTVPDEPPKSVRLSVNMNPETAEALRDLASRSGGISVTEAVRRAVALAHYFAETTDEGNKIQIEDSAGRVKELVLM